MLDINLFPRYNGFRRLTYARVAQWWSIALPRRGSRVRIPSRALKESGFAWFFFVSCIEKKREPAMQILP